MSTTENTLPHWDLRFVYPSLTSPVFQEGFGAAVAAVEELGALFDAYQIARREPAALDEETVAVFEALISPINEVLEREQTMAAYLYAHIAVDSGDETAQARWSEFQHAAVKLSVLSARFAAWIGSLDVDALLDRSALAREYAFVLRRAQEEAAHLMPPEQEALAADLSLVGARAWVKLYDTFTSQLGVPLEIGGDEGSSEILILSAVASEPIPPLFAKAVDEFQQRFMRAQLHRPSQCLADDLLVCTCLKETSPVSCVLYGVGESDQLGIAVKAAIEDTIDGHRCDWRCSRPHDEQTPA